MTNITSFFQKIAAVLSNDVIFLLSEIIVFISAMTVGILLTVNYAKHDEFPKRYIHSFYFLILIILGTVTENIAWMLKISSMLEIISINLKNIQLASTIAWIFALIRYQSLGLFIENLIENKFTFRLNQKIFLTINILFTIVFTYSSISHIYFVPIYPSVHTLYRIAPFYYILSIIPSIIIVLTKLRNKKIPIILKKQLKIFLNYIIFPHLIFDFLQCLPFFTSQGALADTAGIIATLSTLFMAFAIIFCTLNLVRFRFFNFSNKVQDTTDTSLTGSFKDTIEQISLATKPVELNYITQNFFKENFQISNENICLNFRYKQEVCTSENNSCDITSNIIESFINKEDQSTELLQQHKILVADEISFDAYYSSNADLVMLSQFLNNISSEIFLPMYDKNNIIAYLTVKRTNKHKFYSHAEQNKIVIFGTYLASAINIMHNSNMTTLIQENKKAKEELYLKHQEVNQYKESIKNLLKQKSNSQVGILFFKDNKFTLGNEIAQKLLTINLNQQKKHPTTITITKLAEQVLSFRTMQSLFLYDNNNKQLMVSCLPHLDYNGGVILTIHYPDTSDIIKTQIDMLKDPSQIDYLLYLETTKSGKLINQMIPGNNESLLNFKIKLLEIALHKKATLLQSHSDDLISIVEIIHHVSLRSTLHIIDLKPTAVHHNLGTKIFGLNPILMQEPEEPLLTKLDQKGTLFIKNVELLDLETQNKLAHFIRYGLFTIMKSEQRLSSDVRIICSTSQNPTVLVDQNKLSIALYNELSQTTIAMPSLLTMDESELHDLIDGLAHQAVKESNFTNLLQITKKDKNELVDRRPASLHEFKSKIEMLLTQKSKEHHIFHETHFDPEFNVTNPKLLKAANLGKHSLKDSEIMSMLWSQFQCQNKIAQFLGVNRSSVNRRCKEYNLL